MEICKHDEFCGGCIHQGIDYDQQLKAKDAEVKALLKAKGINVLKMDDIEGCPSMYRYRNKMEYTFGDMMKDGPLCLGMHKKKNFMSIITVDECQIVDEDFNQILRFTLDFAVSKGYKHYHKKSHQGLLRNLIVRKGVRTSELLINIVTSSQSDFDEVDFISGLRALELDNEIVGILRTFNDNMADAVNPERMETLWGRDYYMDEILGLKFKVSAFSFFQTNVEAVERLYREAIDLIDDFSGKIAFDLYCGTGTISQVLALKAAKVVGVEIVEEAVDAARENAKLNGLDNCKFIAGDVFQVLNEAAGNESAIRETISESEGLDCSNVQPKIIEKPDVIVVDPPRVGMSTKAVDKIISYGVPQILYISCNPKTLAINLEQFQFYGYEVKYLKAFDNFPMTKHVESVVLLTKVQK